MALTEQRRQQLDGIVKQMVTNKESDSNIQFVVNDFKTKYEGETVKPKFAQKKKSPIITAVDGLAKVGDAIGNFGVGVFKGVADAPRLAAKLGTDVGGKLSGMVFGEGANKPTALDAGLEQTRLTKPSNRAQEIGYGTEKVAEMFVPIGGAAKATAAVRGATEAGGAARVLRSAADVFGRAGREGVEMATRSAAQKGQTDDFATDAAMGAAFPVATKVVAGGLKGAGSVASQFFGRATGAGDVALREAFKNPNVMRYARQAGSEGAERLQQEALEEAQTGLSSIKKARGNQYTSQLKQIEGSATDATAVVDSAGKRAQELMDDFGITRKTDGSLNFEDSTITNNTKIVEKAIRDVQRWGDGSAVSVDALKKRLGQYMDEIPVSERGGARKLVQDLLNTVRSGLETGITGYKEMTTGYRIASDFIDDVQRTMSLTDKATKDTSIRKLMSAMRDNNELRLDMLKQLGTAAGSDVTAKIAGTTLAPIMPRGLVGSFGTAAGGITAALNPQNIPMLLVAFAGASPRIVGEAANLLGGVTRQMQKLNYFSPEIRRGLLNLLQQSQSEHATENSPE